MPTRPDAPRTDERAGWLAPPRWTRRAFVRGSLALGGAVALGGCGTGQRWAGRFLTVATTGGPLGKVFDGAVAATFAAATGCRMQPLALPADDLVAALRQQRFTGQIEWDMVLLDAPRLAALAREVPRLFTPPGDLLALRGVVLPEVLRATGVPILTDTLAVGSRLAPFEGRVPGDWAAVFDSAAFPGPRHFPADPIGILEAAALADGVAPAALYPLDLDRAFGALDRLRSRLTRWWTDSDRAVEALQVGSADILLARSGEVRAALESGAHAALAPVVAPAIPVALAALSGAPNGDVARDFYAHALSPATQGALHEAGYAPIVDLGDDESATLPTVDTDLDWWAAHGREALTRFATWREK